jgi:hypothetical protein
MCSAAVGVDKRLPSKAVGRAAMGDYMALGGERENKVDAQWIFSGGK